MYEIRLNKTSKSLYLQKIQKNIKLTQKKSVIKLNQVGRPGVPGKGLPPGGTVGQYPAKSGSEDYETTWKDLIGQDVGIDPEPINDVFQQGDAFSATNVQTGFENIAGILYSLYELVIGGGGLQSVVAGEGIEVDNTDPLNPVVSALAQPQEYTDFIFNSSGAQEKNRFNSWVDLFNAIPDDRTRITIQLEQDEDWSEAGAYNVDNVEIRGNGNSFISGTSLNLTIQDGVTFSSVVNFVITNGLFFHSQSHQPVAIIDSGAVTVRATEGAAFVTDYCEIFRQQESGALNLNLVPGGVIGNLTQFFGVGYEVVNVVSGTGDGFQVRFGGFSSFIMNNTVRGDDDGFVIIKAETGYFETSTVGIPDLGNLDSTHENYTGGSIDKISLVQAEQIDINAIEGMVSTQVQAALEELAERPTGVPDEAFTEVDMTHKIFNIFTGQYHDLGTGGQFILRYRRVGRQVEGYFVSQWGSDCTYGVIAILAQDLPFVPRTPYGGEVGMFCYIQVGTTSEGADDGFLKPVGSVVSDVGADQPVLLLVQLSGALGDGGGDNLLITNGNPDDLTGRQFSIYGRIVYECAEAEGNSLSIDGDFIADAVQGESYSSTVDIIVTNEDEQLPVTAEFGLGDVPAGLELLADGLELSLFGTPATDGDYIFQVIITDADGRQFIKEVEINVASGTPPSINIPGDWDSVYQYKQHSQTIAVELENEGVQAPVTMSIVSGSLPPSYGINYTQGGRKLRFNGNCDDAGVYNFRVRLVDALGTVYEKDMSCEVQVGAPPVTNPEDDPLYIGTWSPNSHSIVFANGDPHVQLNSPGNVYSATNGEILKVRSASADIAIGSSTYHVEIGDYIQYFGTGGTDGGWQYMLYN